MAGTEPQGDEATESPDRVEQRPVGDDSPGRTLDQRRFVSPLVHIFEHKSRQGLFRDQLVGKRALVNHVVPRWFASKHNEGDRAYARPTCTACVLPMRPGDRLRAAQIMLTPGRPPDRPDRASGLTLQFLQLGGGEGTRTLDLRLAKPPLFQLSYTPGDIWRTNWFDVEPGQVILGKVLGTRVRRSIPPFGTDPPLSTW